jgi:hypothetical protein
VARRLAADEGPGRVAIRAADLLAKGRGDCLMTTNPLDPKARVVCACQPEHAAEYGDHAAGCEWLAAQEEHVDGE